MPATSTSVADRRRLAASVAAGTTLGVVGPVLGVVGAVPLAVGVALAAPLYAVGHVVTRVTTGRQASPAPPPPASEDQEVLASLDQLQSAVDGKVPPAVSARIDRVAAVVRETVPRLDNLGPGSLQAHAVLRTATSYLPEAVNAYVRLPRSFADRRPVSGGKTSLMVLCDQLDLLGSKMDDVFDAVCRHDADALVAHGRFLDDKFGSGSLALDPHQR